LYHNNAHPHVAATAIETILNLKFEVQPHPSHGRDFASCDFHSFGSLKETSRGHRFGSDEEVKVAVHKKLKKQPKTSSLMESQYL
jgi:hypothetical protein